MLRSLRISILVVVCVVGVRGQIDAGAADRRASGPVRRSEPLGKLQVVRAQSGDTLSTIAERYNVSEAELARLNRLKVGERLIKGRRLLVPGAPANSNTRPDKPGEEGQAIGKRIRLTGGRSLIVDEAWRKGSVVWFTRGGVTQSLDAGVESIESLSTAGRAPAVHGSTPALEIKTNSVAGPSVRIYLVGGARFKVDEVNETSAGAWYKRGNLSVFLARERIARIERVQPGSFMPGEKNRDWTSGNPSIDELIKVNATQYGVDPYLVFCVIEQESHFKSRAVSPKGARGLMQLMPGTARRFGVRRPFDPADNIKGGTQYLRDLMQMFNGQVNLVLASYNAGEGAVMKYGLTVPPYRETREYVKRIGKRYGLQGTAPSPENELPVPRR